MTEIEDLKFEIKQLNQSIGIMRNIINKQQQKIEFYNKIMVDWIENQKEEISKLSPNYE